MDFWFEHEWAHPFPYFEKTLFVGVSERFFFPERLEFRSVNWVQKICCHHHGCEWFDPMRAQREKTRKMRVDKVSCYAGAAIFSQTFKPKFLNLWPCKSGFILTLSFPHALFSNFWTGIKNSRTQPSAHIAFKPADMD